MIKEVAQDLFADYYVNRQSSGTQATDSSFETLFSSSKASKSDGDNLFSSSKKEKADESYLNVNDDFDVDESEEADESNGKSLLKNGKAQKTSAETKAKVAEVKSEQTERDAEIAQQNNDDTVEKIQQVQESLAGLSQDQMAIQAQQLATVQSSEQAEQQLQMVEEQIKALQQQAEALEGSDDPADIEKLQEISGQITALTQSAVALQSFVQGQQDQLQSQIEAFKNNTKSQTDLFGRLNDLSSQYKEENDSMQEFAEKSKSFAEKVKDFGDKVDRIGKTMISVGEALIAAGSVSSIFSCGATSGMVTLGHELTSAGNPVHQVGQTVSAIGAAGMGLADITLEITNPAGINIGNFISTTAGAISSGTNLLSQISGTEANLKNIFQGASTMGEKVQELTNIEDLVEKMVA